MSHFVFEWDARKDVRNVAKHGVSFAEAQTAFTDEYARLIADPDHSEDEDRFILMGAATSGRILIVSHCLRPREVIRIISARKAIRQERLSYEGFRGTFS